MARPPLAVGTHGSINTVRVSAEGVKPESWRARTRFRDLDGVTRPVERFGPSRTKAETELQKALQQRLGTPAQKVNDTTRIRDLTAIYLDKVKEKVGRGDRAASTYDRYKTIVGHIDKELGALRVRECDAARLQDVLDELEEQGVSGSTRSTVRTVMRAVMQIAVRRKLLSTNPAKDLDRIEGVSPRKKARALTRAEFLDFMTKLDQDPTAQRTDILDIVRVLFATGMRISEVLALRWRDINMTDQTVRMRADDGVDEVDVPPRSLWVNGGVIYVVGEGAVRNGGKTFSSRRVLGMPDFLHTLFLVRRDEFAADDDPIFPAAKGGWRYPRTINRNLKAARDRIGYSQVTTHWGRKTVAWLLDDAGHSTRQVADVLGQSSIATTQRHYLARGMANPGAVAAIDAWHKQSGE